MAATYSPSVACCSIPPIIAKNYVMKGSYKIISNTKTYVTGSPSATKGLVIVYDIFAYSPQILQGADILATSDKNNQYQVFMPDFFDGQPADKTWFPPNTEDKKRNLDAFFQGVGAPSKSVARIPSLIKAFEKEAPQIKTWGVLGFCWGGKVITLTSRSGTAWKAAAECHPAMLDPNDASGISIPFCLLASKDETKEDVKKFEQNLEGEKLVEIFDDQIHGWMAARSNLEDERVMQEYHRGYQTLLEFFAKYL